LLIFAGIKKMKLKIKSITMGDFLRTGLKTLTMLAVFAISVNAFGQAQMSDVADTFNQGVQMMKINPDAAITSFEKTIELADQVGTDEAMELKMQALTQIPKMYWESAKKLAGKKDYAGAIKKLDSCIETGNTAKDNKLVNRAKSTKLSIINVQGNTALSNGEYDAAIGYFDAALQLNPKYAKALLGKTLVYDKTGDLDKMEEAGIKGIEIATAARDNKTAGTIQQKLRSTFFNSAQLKLQEEDYAGAEKCLSRSVQYGNNNAVVHYQLGLAYEGQQKWNEAIEEFNKSAELDMGSNAEKAKIFFKLGGAYEAAGNNAKACESYKKALHGEFVEAAKYKIETVLACGN
jgi:tetratricopeptide (TPR) repeat protein